MRHRRGRHRKGQRRHAVALAVAVVLTGALAACDDSDGTRVLGATQTREPSSTVTSSEASTSSTTEPVAVSSISATSATTTTTTVPAPTLCHNPLVGYTVTPPAGWYPSGDEAFAPCEAFDRRPAATVLDGRSVEDVAIVIRSLGPVHYLVDPAVPARTGRSVAPTDTRLAGQVTVAGRRAARYESTAGPAGRSYTYLVDAGPTVLAAQYSAPVGQSSRQYADGKRALDQLVASLGLTTPGCLDSADPRCGAFYTTGDPPNAPITVTLPAQPVEAQAALPVSFVVAAADPDADDVRITTSDSCVQIGFAVAVVTGTLRALIRPVPSVEGRYGPWRSPPRPAGRTALTVSRTFPAAGDHTLFVSARSANTAFDPMLDPYGSYQECVEVQVVVRPDPLA